MRRAPLETLLNYPPQLLHVGGDDLVYWWSDGDDRALCVQYKDGVWTGELRRHWARGKGHTWLTMPPLPRKLLDAIVAMLALNPEWGKDMSEP